MLNIALTYKDHWCDMRAVDVLVLLRTCAWFCPSMATAAVLRLWPCGARFYLVAAGSVKLGLVPPYPIQVASITPHVIHMSYVTPSAPISPRNRVRGVVPSLGSRQQVENERLGHSIRSG